MRTTLFLSEAGTAVRRNATMTVAAVLVIGIALSNFGVALLIRQQGQITKQFWFGKVEISMFLCGEDDTDIPSCADGAITDAQRTQIQAELLDLPQVDTVFYESQAEAYELFKKQFPDSAITDNVTADTLPESFRVKLKNPEEDYEAVASAFTGRPGVAQVYDQRALFDNLFSILNGFQRGALVIAGFALVAMVLLIVVVIRVSAFSRRRETGIMRLVGASNLSIQLPFILEGIFAGLVGGLLAGGLLALGKATFITFLSTKIRFTPWVDWSDVLGTSLVLLLGGVIVSMAVSFLTLLKYLRV